MLNQRTGQGTCRVMRLNLSGPVNLPDRESDFGRICPIEFSLSPARATVRPGLRQRALAKGQRNRFVFHRDQPVNSDVVLASTRAGRL